MASLSPQAAEQALDSEDGESGHSLPQPLSKPVRHSSAREPRAQAVHNIALKIENCALAPSRLRAEEVPLVFLVLLGHGREQWVEKLESSPPALQENHQKSMSDHLQILEALRLFNQYVSVGDELGCYPYFQYFFFGIPELAPMYRIRVGLAVGLTGRPGRDYTTDVAVLQQEAADDEKEGDVSPAVLMVLNKEFTMQMIVEVKKRVGLLMLETEALAELLLQAFYVFKGRGTFLAGRRLLCCLADFHNFHYFKLRYREEEEHYYPLQLEQYSHSTSEQPPQAAEYSVHMQRLVQKLKKL